MTKQVQMMLHEYCGQFTMTSEADEVLPSPVPAGGAVIPAPEELGSLRPLVQFCFIGGFSLYSRPRIVSADGICSSGASSLTASCRRMISSFLSRCFPASGRGCFPGCAGTVDVLEKECGPKDPNHRCRDGGSMYASPSSKKDVS